ncbi:MAG: ribulose-phosphate 3-epimerase [Firmicutes bacterium]|nr:ribulose-phosphate 3-epimerase [Bacillota bacterium]
MAKIAPSLLSADFTRLGEEVKEIESVGTEILHIDIMDGHFVPNLTFGYSMVKALRPVSDMIYDVHLMMTNPLSYIENFAKAGSDIITVHTECDDDINKCLDLIHKCGVKAGLSVKPKTSPDALFPYLDKLEHILVMTVEPGFGGQSMMTECLDKIAVIKAECASRGLNIPVMIDGGVNADNVQTAARAGADMMVAGNAVFGAKDRAAAFKTLSEGANL